MAKIYAALLACSFLATTNAIDIELGTFVTWNTNGGRWSGVQSVLKNENPDVLVIQEAGLIYRQITPIMSTASCPPIYLDDIELTMGPDNVGITYYPFTENGHAYHMYYYDNRVKDVAADAVKTRAKQNLAIISKTKADAIQIFPNELRERTTTTPASASTTLSSVAAAEQEERNFINRPVFGIRLGNSFIFNIHGEPLGGRANEVNIHVHKIANFMRVEARSSTWLMMGDFNVPPTLLHLPNVADRFIRIIQPRVATQEHGNILDYGVVGGDAGPGPNMEATTLPQYRGSDHIAVRFRRAASGSSPVPSNPSKRRKLQ